MVIPSIVFIARTLNRVLVLDGAFLQKAIYLAIGVLSFFAIVNWGLMFELVRSYVYYGLDVIS